MSDRLRWRSRIIDGSAGKPPSVVIVNDTFTAPDGTLLQNHVGEIGAAWTLNIAVGTGNSGTIENNRFRTNGILNLYRASGVPPTADYYVEGLFTFVGMTASDNIGIAARMAPGVETCYYVRHAEFASNWSLNWVVNGAGATLGTWTDVFDSGQRVVRLDVKGSTIRVLVDGVQRIVATDTNITAKGFAGIRGGNIVTPTTGRHLDQIVAFG